MADETSTSNSDIEQRIRAGLADLVAAAPDPASRRSGLVDREFEYRGNLLRRRDFLVGAAATTAAAGVGLWILAGRDDGSGTKQVSVRPVPTTEPRRSGEWRRIGSAPLSPRSSPFIVWAGDRLIVWGGTANSGPDYTPPPDGASWTPASETWAAIAPAPAGVIQNGFAVWDGREVFVGLTEADASATNPLAIRYGIVAYDPIADRWRHIASVVPDSDKRLGSARQAVRVGNSLLVAVRFALPGASGHDGDAFFVDVTSGQRRALDPGPFAVSPYPDASGDVTLAVVGDVVVATPNWDLRPWVLDVGAGTWRRVTAPPGAESLHLLPATAAGAQAFFFESDARKLWAFDPAGDGPGAWRAAARNPFPSARWGYDPVWSGRELFVPGAAYDPNHDSWRAVAPPPRGKERQRTMQARWTGAALLLFGGEEYSCPDNGVCDRMGGPDTLDGWLLTDP